MNTRNFAEIFFRGFSQVMLQNNVITGILFLMGIFYNSWLMGAGAITGVLTGMFTSILLKYDKNDINKGLYGFNGALVGVAVIFFFGLNAPSIIAIIFGSILSAIITNIMIKRKVPPYTAPFVISTWVMMLLIITLNIVSMQTTQLSKVSNIDIISALSMGIGQVMFQENIITGIIFLIAILVSSRISAIYALLGSSLGVVISFVFSLPLNMINIGLFGFNAVLCGIAFANKKWSYLFLAISAIIISIFVTYGMISFGIITLTAPFVISTWLVLLLKRKQFFSRV